MDDLQRLWRLREDLTRCAEWKRERDELILRLLRAGRSQRWVAKQAGVARGTVQWVAVGRPERRRGGRSPAA